MRFWVKNDAKITNLRAYFLLYMRFLSVLCAKMTQFSALFCSIYAFLGPKWRENDCF
jgi:hypothetical protein